MSELDLYQELIIDHGTQPRNHHAILNPTHTAKGNNPICGDKIHLYLNIENNIIKQATFEGEGCAISTASASIMSELLKDKTVSQAEDLFQIFHNLLTQKSTTGTNNPKLDALGGVKDYPMRIKCATLPWHALEHALHSDPSEVNTESLS